MALTLKHFFDETKNRYELNLLTPYADMDVRLTWVHLLEDINNCSFIRKGELIITTGLAARDSQTLFELISRIQASDASGLILNIGSYIQEIPQDIITWCKDCHFPLLTMPWHIHIADLMHDYCNEILSEVRVQERKDHALAQSLSGISSSEFLPVIQLNMDCRIYASDEKLSLSCYASTCHEGIWYHLCTTSQEAHLTVPAGISAVLRTDHLKKYALQAKQALILCKYHQKLFLKYETLGLYQIAFSICEPELYQQAKEKLSLLSSSELKKTLRLYLEYNGSVKDVAEYSYVHRNTINYRMQQIRDLIHDDLDSGKVRLDYLMAFYLCDVMDAGWIS